MGGNTKSENNGYGNIGNIDTDSTFKPKSNKLAEAMAAKRMKDESSGGVLGTLAAAAGRLTGLSSSDAGGHAAMLAKYEAQQQQQPASPTMDLSGPSASGPTGATQAWGFTQEQAGGAAVEVKDSEVLTPMQKLVAQYTSRPSAPGRAEVSAFTRELSAMDCDDDDEVSVRLDEKLDPKSNNWQTRLSALTLVEALLKGNNQEVIAYFKENPEDVQKNVQVMQTTVKEKAKKVLGLLGCPESSPKAAAVPQQRVNVLGTYVDPHNDPAEVDAAAAAPTGAPPAGTKPKKKAGAVKLKKRKKADAPAAPAPADLAAVGAGGDLFAGLMTAGASAPQQQQQQQQQPIPAPVQQQGGGLDDLLFSSPQRAVQQQQQQQQQQSPAVGQDGFGFLSASSAGPLAPTPQSTPVAGAPAQGFDFSSMLAGSGSGNTSASGSGNVPPTPLTSPTTGQMPAVAGSATLEQIEAQKAALQAQIDALVRQQQMAQQGAMPQPNMNAPPLPPPTNAGQRPQQTQAFDFIGQHLQQGL